MIVSYSEALIDQQKDEYTLGGCGFNFIRCASLLGSSTLYLSALSNDVYGKQLLDMLIQDLVVFAPPLCNINLPTPKAIVSLDEKSNASYEFILDNTCLTKVTTEDYLAALEYNENVTTIHNGGLNLYTEPMASNILEAYKKIRKKYKKARLAIDLNLREHAIIDKAKVIAILKEYYKVVDIVKASDEDIAYLGFNDPQDYYDSIDVDILLYTAGAEGSTYYSKDLIHHQDAMETIKVDSIGCGDVYFATFLHYLDGNELNHKLIIDAMYEATKKATHTLSCKGAVLI